MFTGIVAAQGRLAAVETVEGDRRLQVLCDDGYLDAVADGDSICVNGVCLTAAPHVARGFMADVSVETLSLTTIGRWRVGDAVNLERATTPQTALGGHLVLGHVDGVAVLQDVYGDARSRRLRFRAPHELARYIAHKGSVTLDGVSLTVNEVEGDDFGVNIIPVTWTHTSLGRLVAGDVVNLEVDLVARYVERLLAARGI
ncbi:MAG TPA: riboflavin synthase [Nevskiaceae bacterium]|nr:riboflavin synthase [Nevskiaceae bacterium]